MKSIGLSFHSYFRSWEEIGVSIRTTLVFLELCPKFHDILIWNWEKLRNEKKDSHQLIGRKFLRDEMGERAIFNWKYDNVQK